MTFLNCDSKNPSSLRIPAFFYSIITRVQLRKKKWLCSFLPFPIVCTNLDFDKAKGEFPFCIQAAGYYTEVALENVTE